MTAKLNNILIVIIASIALSSGCKNKSIDKQIEIQNDLIGKWEVFNSTFLPFEHISFCDTLGIGSTFNFKSNGELEVFYPDKKANCNAQQNFELDSNYIRMQEWDMLFNYEIIKLNSDSLSFKIRRIPSYVFEDSLEVVIKSEIQPTDQNFYTRIKKEGIVVNLMKIDDD